MPGVIAVLAGAGWLRALWMPAGRAVAVPYLLVCGAATVLLLLLARRAERGRAWALACGMASGALALLGVATQTELSRITADWPATRARIERDAIGRLDGEVARTVRELRDAATRALDAPSDTTAAFAALDGLRGGTGERGIVLVDRGEPLAWSGRMRTPVERLQRPIGVDIAPFYITLYASAERDGRRAVATALLHAEPPADRLAAPLDALVAARTQVTGFDYAPPRSWPGTPGMENAHALGAGGAGPDTLVLVRPSPTAAEEVHLHLAERARERGALLIAIATLALLVGGWHGGASGVSRALTLVATLGTIAIVPLNSLSNVTQLFDPLVYYAPLGGPFTSSVGALALTSALLLLALFTVLRSRARLRSRWLALLFVVAVAALGPFLLRDLARGINGPPHGIPTGLWISWEVALFLAAVVILLAGVSAGRVALGQRRGLSGLVAPLLATVAAMIAPRLWEAPAGWPPWYSMLWIAAIALLAFTRRARGFVVSAAVVAALGAITLVWGATARKRVELAVRDVAGLSAAEPGAVTLLARLGEGLAGQPAPVTRAELLRAYVESDLSSAGFPTELSSWSADAGGIAVPTATLVIADFQQPSEQLAELVTSARDSQRVIVREARGDAGVQVLLAVPHADGVVTTVAIAPRTRLIADDPFTALIGLAPYETTEPPYTLTLASDLGGAVPTGQLRWQRKGDELHGDWVLSGPNGPTRVHVEVELRSPAALVQRGALLVVLDLTIILGLWTLSAAARGGLARWVRARVRGWWSSFRARLTLALFAFFVVPAVTFAIWSYRRLQSEDRQSRELLVRETLRSIGQALRFERPEEEARRVGIPLFVYENGELRGTSDPLYDVLAPVGRFLDPQVTLNVAFADEVGDSQRERVGGVPTLFGYRATTGENRERLVLATPARSDEIALDRQRRDLGILVLFATMMGAIAALTLSGLAARELARPIGSLRHAALAIAAGEREPELGVEPPGEFRPVFSAFRRMAADLAASRHALEEAQRRTEAVLRNVASGVIGTDSHGRVTLANPRAEALLQHALPPGAALPAVDEGGVMLGDRLRAFLASEGDEEEFDVELHGHQLHGRLTRVARGTGGAVLTLDDVTELARAQRVLAWGEMARQVAHEIKNPLTPIRLGVQHLKRARGDGRVDFDRVLDQNVERILAEIDHLDEIARAFSKYGMAPGERAPGEVVDAGAVVRDVVELEQMGRGEVDWRTHDLDAPVPAIARTDELREVLLNVLENARLAGARRVDVRVGRERGRVCIAVRDDGHGIAPDVLPRIFEPHFSTRTSGSGLGLAISRTLVEGWGGTIEVASEPNMGTTVTIVLASAPTT
jgi:signal transduction histidine kinase